MTTDPVAAWVSRVNRLAAEIDATAASLHPSAWPEALAPDSERFRRLAANGPANLKFSRNPENWSQNPLTSI